MASSTMGGAAQGAAGIPGAAADAGGVRPAPGDADGAGTTEALVAASGGYELLKQRLAAQGDALRAKAQALNAARVAAFGRSEQALVLRTRARTANNCVARDIVRIGELLLFGYNVFIGLRKETAVADVFGLYRLAEHDGAEELEAVPLAGSFLEEGRFAADFRELYAYYRQAQLVQLRVTQDKLLAAFQIGQQAGDLRVFRWRIAPDGGVHYVDNRGERDIALPPAHDVEWTVATREDHVGGRHPHINILDTVFVETIGGDLTIKVENNTETGLGIYSEPVEDRSQALGDAEVAYARVGALVLLRVRPYRETASRYLVFNARTQKVERIDAIGISCVQLPEDHGLIFPGGIYLQSGELRRFELAGEVLDNLRFKRLLRSPNGEDVLYVFYQPGNGHYALCAYNLIEKSLAPPIVANGYALYPDGRVLVFLAGKGEPTRLHPMQLWRTPFASEEHALATPPAGGFFGRIGNAELVRGISELMALSRAVGEQAPTRAAYEDLVRQCGRTADAYFWLAEPEAGPALPDLRAIADGARATLAEFEKVEQIRRETARALAEAETAQKALLVELASTLWRRPEQFIEALGRLRERRGHLQMARELRFADLPHLDGMDAELVQEQQRVGERALQFLAQPLAFDVHRQGLEQAARDIAQAGTAQGLQAQLDALDKTAAGLDLLAEQLGGLPGGDAVLRTAILDRISALYAEVNRLRADARGRRKALGATEAAAEFGAQFKLFGQAVENALAFADTPQKCDEALTRLLAQLEELEGRFAEQDAFLADITAKREAVVEAVAAHRAALSQVRRQRVQALLEAANRILEGAARRSAQCATAQEVHGFFAADPLVGKLRGLVQDVRALDEGVAADELDTRLKTCRDRALRLVRDQRELAADGGDAIRLGRHAFTVSRQPLDLALVPAGDGLAFQLTGTDYLAPLGDPRAGPLRAFWQQALPSETPALARAEYLAGCVLQAALQGEEGLDLGALLQFARQGDDGHAGLLEAVRRFMAPRYQDGYAKGVHDEDAVRLLAVLLPMQHEAGLLACGPQERACALLYWHHVRFEADRQALQRRARAACRMEALFGDTAALRAVEAECAEALAAFAQEFPVLAPSPSASQGAQAPSSAARERAGGEGSPSTPGLSFAQAASYLVRELAHEAEPLYWAISAAAEALAAALSRELERAGQLAACRHDLEAAPAPDRWQLARDWTRAYAAAKAPGSLGWADEAATVLAVPATRRRIHAALDAQVSGLRSEHPRIAAGTLALNLNDFLRRLHHHQQAVLPRWRDWQALRHELLETGKAGLRLQQFQAKPLPTFVRNRLVDEVYLPLVGDNFAKQLGAAGDGARTDRMGLLLLISPPGYGKTTLLEYVADRLGLVFVRINCPALGHGTDSLDPAAAPDSASRQELEKLNLALAMGSNVLLVLDDIQHTSPAFLQKFIGLADGTRRIEGVWNGQARTWDLRGKRFAIAMAGNPYTESGEAFRIPDMLANRCDIHNLGDVLSGQEQLFALSYLENCLTSHPALLPLASREPKDVHLLVRLAAGEPVAASDFAHAYGAAELEELRALMQRLLRVRDALLKVNLAYIASAAQRDAYRTEPPFKLQGSYRNMTKLAGRVTPQMTDAELDALLRDHYRGEAQTLTTGAEENLLKLAALLGTQTPAERERWQSMCEDFVRTRKAGGEDADGSTRIAHALLDVGRAVESLRPVLESENRQMAEAVLQLAVTYRKVIMPLVAATEKRLDLDKGMREEINRLMKMQVGGKGPAAKG